MSAIDFDTMTVPVRTAGAAGPDAVHVYTLDGRVAEALRDSLDVGAAIQNFADAANALRAGDSKGAERSAAAGLLRVALHRR